MIDRDEIDATSRLLGVNTSDVQRDYLYGWLLAGLYGDSPLLRDRLVLKGGNAFRKGYFVATRFSGDLDFTAPTGLDPEQLLRTLNEVCRMIGARTGVTFDLDRNRQVDQRSIDSGKTVHKFALYFNDFYGNASKMTISMRMDVTEYGRLYLPIQQRKLIHPYSDQADCATSIEVVSLEEALADKLKCLLQRHMSSDLFDLVYSIFVNNDVSVDKATIVKTFLRKTIFEPSPQAALGLLLAVPFEVMRVFWGKIICAEESLLDFTTAVERFKGELKSLFSTFQYGDARQLAFFPAELRTPIMEAGRTQTLLRVTYDGVERLVEPYSLAFKWRNGGVGQEYLYVWDVTGGNSGPGIKSLFNWKITDLVRTDIKFEPRFEIELAKAGEYATRTTFDSNRSGIRRSTRPRARHEPRYRVRCAYCQRVFDRDTTSTVIRPHKDSFGNPCPGRRGYRM
ncbi:nucleotidyl transferase AbiEii/AbiGii toxin family protein [Microbispora bryophytorum]|uniref:nucleotidyl transferase AbiEii/AbiGii toxin family protein n=1 Tax=Microbispora bryophytorum TaxID=1460882 RepID=UPI0033D3DEAF